MTDQTDRPEVDDPRVLALAKARQQLAYESPFNAVCPPWDGLTEQEQRLSLLDARSYLHAALNAGLVATPAAPAPATDQAALRDRIAALFRTSAGAERLGDATPGEIADAVMVLLAGPVDIDPPHVRAARYAAAGNEMAASLVRDGFGDDEIADILSRPIEQPPADRAAILREAADALVAVAGQHPEARAVVIHWGDAAALLRTMAQEECDELEAQAHLDELADDLSRMADEAQQPTPDIVAAIVAALQKRAGELSELAEEQMRPSLEERAQEWLEAAGVARRAAKAAVAMPEKEAPAPFTPPAHYRRDDGVDCCVHTIPVGPDSCCHCRELHDDELPAAGARQADTAGERPAS